MGLFKKRRTVRKKKKVATTKRKTRKVRNNNTLPLVFACSFALAAFLLLGPPRQTLLHAHQYFWGNPVASAPQKGIIITQNTRLSLWPLPFMDTGPLLNSGEDVLVLEKNKKWVKIMWHTQWYWMPPETIMVSENS